MPNTPRMIPVPQKRCPACNATMDVTVAVCWSCGNAMMARGAQPVARPRHASTAIAWILAATVGGGVGLVCAVGGSSQLRDGRDPCDGHATEREIWIKNPAPEMGGYAPATLGMSATGVCSTTLRVREKDCSIGRLYAAYGSKRFMPRIRSLGFQRMSCGYEDYELSVVAPMPSE